MRNVLLALVVIVLAGCGGGAAPPTPDEIVQRFEDAGLTVQNIETETREVLLEALAESASTCEALRFEANDDGDGVRVVVCGTPDDARKVEIYYTALGEESAMLFSHVHADENLVLQGSGDLDEELFDQYVAELP